MLRSRTAPRSAYSWPLVEKTGSLFSTSSCSSSSSSSTLLYGTGSIHNPNLLNMYTRVNILHYIYIYKVVIFVCLFFSIITQEPLDRIASKLKKFYWGTQETHVNVLGFKKNLVSQ